MKERYRVIQRSDRGGGCYCVDNQTGERTSLGTRDRKEAARLVRHKNEALKNPHINRKIGMAYLAAVDPSLVTRTWSDVMANVILDKQGPTLHRWKTAIKDHAFDLIRPKVVVATLAEDFQKVLIAGTVSTNVFLRRLQNHCLDMGWLPVPILSKKKFPKIKHKEKRAVTWDEHCRIIAREGMTGVARGGGCISRRWVAKPCSRRATMSFAYLRGDNSFRRATGISSRTLR
ncbi:MAG: hypothetical protein ABSE81_07625 [Candidatus Omnitrophota bacterium]|jgi:hypothetical protein